MFSPKLEEIQKMAANRELDMIKVDARKMAIDIVHYVPKYQTPPDPSDPGKTMRRTVDEMIVKHEIKFKSMIQHLVKNLDFPVDAEEDSQNMIKRTFDGVVHAMFSDEKITWGRIVALYAFGGLVAKHCVQNNMQDYVDFCGDLVADHVCDYLFRWILHKGGWVGI